MSVTRTWEEHLVHVPEWLQRIFYTLGFTIQTNTYREEIEKEA